jgi:hypothetical protein
MLRLPLGPDPYVVRASARVKTGAQSRRRQSQRHCLVGFNGHWWVPAALVH